MAARLKAAVARGEITTEEAWARWAEINREDESDPGIRGHYRRMGISPETLDRIRGALNENGLEEKQLEEALGGLLRVIHTVKSEGVEAELDPRLLHYFREEVDLTGEQIELIRGMAIRVVHEMRSGDRERTLNVDQPNWEAIKRRIEGAVERGDLTREEADAKYRELKK